MNLYASDECPRRAAQNLDDRRVVEAARECASLLSTAVRLVAPDEARSMPLYRMSHEAHPVSRWVRSSFEALQWTLQHGLALLGEYAVRFPQGPVHRASPPIHAVLGAVHSVVQPRMFRPLGGQPPSLLNHACDPGMGLDFTGGPDPVASYRALLVSQWKHDARASVSARPAWSNRGAPAWSEPYL